MKATGKPVAQIIDTTLHFERYWIANSYPIRRWESASTEYNVFDSNWYA